MHPGMVILRAKSRHADALAAAMLLKNLLSERQRARLQKSRKCKQGHHDHAEGNNAYVEAYAEQDEHEVFVCESGISTAG